MPSSKRSAPGRDKNQSSKRRNKRSEARVCVRCECIVPVDGGFEDNMCDDCRAPFVPNKFQCTQCKEAITDYSYVCEMCGCTHCVGMSVLLHPILILLL